MKVKCKTDSWVDMTKGKTYNVHYEDPWMCCVYDDSGDERLIVPNGVNFEVIYGETEEEASEKPTSEFSGVVWKGMHFQATCPEEYLEISEAINKLEVFRLDA
jgi:glucose dehydrogenase